MSRSLLVALGLRQPRARGVSVLLLWRTRVDTDGHVEVGGAFHPVSLALLGQKVREEQQVWRAMPEPFVAEATALATVNPALGPSERRVSLGAVNQSRVAPFAYPYFWPNHRLVGGSLPEDCGVRLIRSRLDVSQR